jgi:hypothetical protein
MEDIRTRDTLVEMAKAFGISEELLKHLSVTSLRRIIEYETEVKDGNSKVQTSTD